MNRKFLRTSKLLMTTFIGILACIYYGYSHSRARLLYVQSDKVMLLDLDDEKHCEWISNPKFITMTGSMSTSSNFVCFDIQNKKVISLDSVNKQFLGLGNCNNNKTGSHIQSQLLLMVSG